MAVPMVEKVMRFRDRIPVPRTLKIGNQRDNLAERVCFALPGWIAGADVFLHTSLGDKTDVIRLDAERGFAPERTLTQYPGQWTAYLEALLDGDVVWHSDPFLLQVGHIPDDGEKLEQAYPTVVEEALRAAAQVQADKATVSEDRAAVEVAQQAVAEDAAQVAQDKQAVAEDRRAVEQAVGDINDSTSRIAIETATLPEGAAATGSATISPEEGIRLKLGIPRGDTGFAPEVDVMPIDGGNRVTITDSDGSQSFDVMDGNVMYATFDLDPATGMLTMTTPDKYAGPGFKINDNGYLEVIVGA